MRPSTRPRPTSPSHGAGCTRHRTSAGTTSTSGTEKPPKRQTPWRATRPANPGAAYAACLVDPDDMTGSSSDARKREPPRPPVPHHQTPTATTMAATRMTTDAAAAPGATADGGTQHGRTRRSPLATNAATRATPARPSTTDAGTRPPTHRRRASPTPPSTAPRTSRPPRHRRCAHTDAPPDRTPDTDARPHRPPPTHTPQQPPQRSRAPRTARAIAGLLTAAALAALALHDEPPHRPRAPRARTAEATLPPRLTLLGGALLLAAAAHSLPKAASSPAPAPGRRHRPRHSPSPRLTNRRPRARQPRHDSGRRTGPDMDATTQAMIDHEISATSDTAAAGHLQSGDTQAPTARRRRQ